jgi:thiamine biosynthesis lipoprotein
MTWQSAEREVQGEIMRTDVFVKIFSDQQDALSLEKDLDRAFALFREFESRFSRFREESELSIFNRSSSAIVSVELFDLLLRSQAYVYETEGVFDPTILPALEQEGYQASFGSDRFGVPAKTPSQTRSVFSDIVLNPYTRQVSKPKECRVDLGGIGKGYIVDRVAQVLRKTYTHFIVDAGGDMYIAGSDPLAGYPYSAIDIEDARYGKGNVGLLLLSNRGVATSGVNRRKWQQGQEEKSHLIDTRRQQSVASDALAVTVVAGSTERADVMAKTLCLLGWEQGKKFAQEKRIPAFFILKNGTIEANNFMQPYLWQKEG